MAVDTTYNLKNCKSYMTLKHHLSTGSSFCVLLNIHLPVSTIFCFVLPAGHTTVKAGSPS